MGKRHFIIDFLRKIAPLIGIGTTESYLKESLKNATSVLELGCGKNSVTFKVTSVPYVGVELYEPYYIEFLEKQVKPSQARGRNVALILQDINSVMFPINTFSHVVMIDVLEHLSFENGKNLLRKMENWAPNIIIKTTNGFVPQLALDGNSLQEHVSGWSVSDLTSLGFKVKGLSGEKLLRVASCHEEWSDDLSNTMRWRPKIFWLYFAALTQLYCRYSPRRAFELYAEKNSD
jgi:hypothetical protein